jgi:hypothetical protein
MARKYPDGYVSPAGVPAGTGGGMRSAGGVGADGAAERHTQDTRVPRQNFGFRDAAKVIGGPDRARNGEGQNIGPSSDLWRRAAKPVYTTGDQKRRK